MLPAGAALLVAGGLLLGTTRYRARHARRQLLGNHEGGPAWGRPRRCYSRTGATRMTTSTQAPGRVSVRM
jgi:hypothetical protein